MLCSTFSLLLSFPPLTHSHQRFRGLVDGVWSQVRRTMSSVALVSQQCRGCGRPGRVGHEPPEGRHEGFLVFTISYRGILTPKPVEFPGAVVLWPLWPFLMVPATVPGLWKALLHHPVSSGLSQCLTACVCASENEVWTRGGLLCIVMANR